MPEPTLPPESNQQPPVYRTTIAEAKALADATSIFQDLAFTFSALDRLAELSAQGSKDAVVMTCLWSSALVAYARCFAHGQRYRLDESAFDAFHPSALKFHRFVIGRRDKHVAHSVNPFEQVAIGIVLNPPDSPAREVIGVAALTMKLVGWNDQGIADLRHLVGGLQQKVGLDCKRLQSEVEQAARRLPVETIAQQPTLRLTAPGPEEAPKERT